MSHGQYSIKFPSDPQSAHHIQSKAKQAPPAASATVINPAAVLVAPPAKLIGLLSLPLPLPVPVEEPPLPEPLEEPTPLELVEE